MTTHTMSRFMYVELTATDNQYLAPSLPLKGFIELFEMGNSGTIIAGVFRIENAAQDGLQGGPVEVKNPQFRYTGAHPPLAVAAALRKAVRA